ncbi:MAG: ATP-binding protein [Candidatus Pacebacteria bacterium]|nr:ATP-binding protein [Candidatus Paceibacterota bacterium]
MNNEQIQQYLQNQINRSPSLLRSYVEDAQGNKYLTREIYDKMKLYIENFVAGGKELRIIGIPGLRGVGKTTILAQLYFLVQATHPTNVLYISTDQIINELNSDLFTVLDEYQKILGNSFEKSESEIFLFIDEIHFDKKWTSVLKTLYDKSKRVFVVCTGSSALSLKSTADLARRVIFEKLYPMSFVETMLLKTKYESLSNVISSLKLPIQGLSKSIKQALIYSADANECYSNLSELDADVKKYWFGIETLEVDKYLKYSSMPFALTISSEQHVYMLTNQLIDRVIERDLSELGSFDTSTLSSIKNILLLVAGSSEVSLTSVAKSLRRISLITLANILESLEKAEILIRVYPYGSTYKKVRKPSKYHFMTPAIRYALLSIVEGENAFLNHKGKYMEDVVALSLHQNFSDKNASPIFYDSSKGGADFLLSLSNKKIPIEVGYGKKLANQAEATLKKLGGKYGIVVSDSELILKNNIVKVPLKYFLLM